MDVEWALRKLRPLMPRQVEQWQAVREGGDAKLRDLLDRQIISTARLKFGDAQQRILLSLPPEHQIKGAFKLGTVLYEREKWPAGLRASELLQNICVFGRSGAGKTNFVYSLLAQLAEAGVPFLFFDWKRTMRHLLPRLRRRVQVFTPGRRLSPFPFNPFIAPPGLEYNAYVAQVVDVLAAAYTLGEGARRVLQAALFACRERGIEAPSVTDVLERLREIPEVERVRGWKLTATRALESLAFSGIGNSEPAEQQRFARTLIHRNTIVELDGLTQGAAAFVVPLLLLWIFYLKLAEPRREQLDLFCVLEEAHHLLYKQERRAKESIMNTILRQSRETGIGFAVVDQHPHLISSAALGNCLTTVCLQLKHPADVQTAAAVLQLDDAERRYLGQLKVGQGIVRFSDRWREPFLVQFPHVEHEKGAMTDARLEQYLRGKSTGSGANWADGGVSEQVPRVRLWDRPLDEGAVAFLWDVIAHPGDGVKARYHRLALSGSRGDALKRSLLDQGWLEGQAVALGRTRKFVLRLTSGALQAMDLRSEGTSKEGVAHGYWKHWYARKLQEQGYEVRVEAPRVGGRVDVLATKDGKRTGIEIETGRSDVVSNVKNCLRSRFDRVVVVATDRLALPAVERSLGRAGLLIAPRVDIVLAGGSSALERRLSFIRGA